MNTTTFELRAPRETTETPSVAARAWSLLELWRSRARQRRQLAQLSPELLWDIGVTADSARAETQKAFWRV